MLVLEIILFNY